MSFENSSGLGVSNFYGPMTQREATEGHRRTEGTVQEINLHMSEEAIANGDFARNLAFIAENGKPMEAIVQVVSPFTVGLDGIDVGTEGTETVDGFTIPQADAQAAGVYVYSTFNGSWAGALPGDTDIGVAGAVTGTGGFAVVTVRYYQVTG